MPSAEAYDATLRGRALRQQATEASLHNAKEYFERAIGLDPDYAPAHAGLADVYHVLGGPGWEFQRPREVLLRAMSEATRAIDLDPRFPMATLSVGCAGCGSRATSTAPRTICGAPSS